MSRPNVPPTNYRGRYNGPVPTSNLLNDEEDFPELETFDSEATPRTTGPAPGGMGVQHVDMCQQINAPSHYTTAFDNPNLIIRRGQEFTMRITFDRPMGQADEFQVEFLIGANPSVNKGSQVIVTFGPRSGGLWTGRIMQQQGQTLVVGITPTPNAIVGKYRTYVGVMMGGNVQRTKRDATTDLYVLVNAWCPNDGAFLNNEAERMEYVLNDYGVIYQGSAGAVGQRSWNYGQFERGILDACIYILDVSRMPIYDRGNLIKLVRVGSAMVNSQDDRGVLVGNWDEDFSMGRSPTSWTGSVKILLEYANTGVPICYAQCWVFAGVFNTFLRALGIPSRVITNFSSAHDNTGNLKIDLICNPDGSPDERNTRDSIWNYHCWNESWITRPDLPSGLGGWQVVDSTPQETSDGLFRCGPAPVSCIKEGVLCHPYDSGFVFAEVNSDVCFFKRDKYGNLSPYKVETAHVGQALYTKAVGNNSPSVITHTYKYPEGSAQDERTMTRAEEFNCARDHPELPETNLSVFIYAGQVALGQDVNLQLEFSSQSALPQTVRAHLASSVIFYTGVRASRLKDRNFTVVVPPNQKVSEMVRLTAQEYTPFLGSQISLQFILTAQTDDQTVTDIKVLGLQTPTLTMAVSGQPQVKQEMFVSVSFTNPFTFALNNVQLSMEGPGLMSERERFYRVIEAHASISWKEAFTPRLPGHRCLTAVMDASNLRQVMGVVHVDIIP